MNEANKGKKYIIDNKGMSLVELIIGVFILSIILTSLFFFISVTTKAVKKSNDEAKLQLTNQTVTNQLQSAIMEAKVIAIQERLPAESLEEGFHTYTNNKTGLIDVRVLFIDETVFVFDELSGTIYFKDYSISGGLLIEKMDDATITGIMTDGNILSKQIKEFMISIDTLSTGGYVDMKLVFEKGNNVMESSNKVLVRNYR